MEDIGCCLVVSKDRNQRPECGCFESVETRLYDTCRSGGRYCYANYSSQAVKNRVKAYDPMSPLLCGTIEPGDKITERKTKPRKDMQRRLSF